MTYDAAGTATGAQNEAAKIGSERWIPGRTMNKGRDEAAGVGGWDYDSADDSTDSRTGWEGCPLVKEYVDCRRRN